MVQFREETFCGAGNESHFPGCPRQTDGTLFSRYNEVAVPAVWQLAHLNAVAPGVLRRAGPKGAAIAPGLQLYCSEIAQLCEIPQQMQRTGAAFPMKKSDIKIHNSLTTNGRKN